MYTIVWITLQKLAALSACCSRCMLELWHWEKSFRDCDFWENLVTHSVRSCSMSFAVHTSELHIYMAVFFDNQTISCWCSNKLTWGLGRKFSFVMQQKVVSPLHPFQSMIYMYTKMHINPPPLLSILQDKLKPITVICKIYTHRDLWDSTNEARIFFFFNQEGGRTGFFFGHD